jgi:chemotaxis protein methyltransferase CheR
MIGAVLVAVAGLHLVLALHGVRRSLNLTFVLLALLIAFSAFVTPLRYLADSIPRIVWGVKLSQGAITAYGIVLVWFTREYAEKDAWRIPTLLTALGCLTIGLHLYLPYSLFYEHVEGLRSFGFPGGGLGHVLVGRNHPLLYLPNAFGVGVVSYAVGGCIRLWRGRGRRSRALAFSAGIAPLAFLVFPHGVLVNRGLAEPPVYYTFAFLAIVAAMSYDIVSDTALSVRLSRQVRSNERKWRTLLERVSLHVLICDRQGNIEYANQFLLRTGEFEATDVVGQPFDVLFPASEIPSLRQVFGKAMQGEVLDTIQTGFLTRSKKERVVYWSNVLVYGDNDEITGILSLGSDLTDRVNAEKARDEAMAQLAEIRKQLEAENTYLRLEYEGNVDSTDLIGKSDAMLYVLHKIAQVASTNATVLIEGETGVGKELVARAVHNASSRARMPFVRVNCAALPSNLIESELFGHERGSFTGADRAHPGRFELAEGGTILLDEVGELALDVQAKLLRVLQEGEYDRIGGTKTRKADVRVIASTNRNLHNDVAAGRFREDLYYRLQVFPISVPPLRDRREDIPLLVHHFVQRLSQKHRRPIKEIPITLVDRLSLREWPGNVRELENVLERAVITSDGPVLRWPEDNGISGNGATIKPQRHSLTLDAVERHHIEQILKQTRGQIAGPGGAAEILGLHPNTLRGRMAKLGVERPR